MTLFIVKIIAGTALLLLTMLLALLGEGVDRIVHARMQNRIGPPALQPIYDVLKLLGKENIVPRRAVAWLFNGAPLVALVTALMVILYVPIGSLPPILGGEGDLILILYLFALSAVAMVVGGFASGSTYANVGSQREMVLMMSYELPLAVVVCTLAWAMYHVGAPGQPFSLETFVAMPVWNVLGPAGVFGVLALLGTMLAVVPAEVAKVPMDIAEAKTEILEGLIAEYSGRNLALLKLTFAARTLVMCAVVVALFFPFSLGKGIGFSGFFLFVVDFVWFWAKVLAVQIVGVTLLRTAFGRFKPWQASRFYWVQVAGFALAGMVLISLDIAM
ncbi:MAG: NADH-quinone oxidoreductase subunit H [Synergistales bacterium]|nr:NADH-quinone oxidoreductase subunit H [Synergistales bacterium]